MQRGQAVKTWNAIGKTAESKYLDGKGAELYVDGKWHPTASLRRNFARYRSPRFAKLEHEKTTLIRKFIRFTLEA